MSHNSFAMYENVVPGVAPLDTITTAVSTQWVDLKAAHSVAFLAYFGVITAASADQSITLTVEASTVAASTSGANIAFNYRQSGVAAANTWGAVTAATSAGLAVATTDDGTMFWIEVDPAAVAAAKADARWVKCEVTPNAGGTATNVAVVAIVEPRYAMATMLSTT